MADFDKAFELLGKGIEWNDCENIFKINKRESAPTFAGVYLKYYKHTLLYSYLKEVLKEEFNIDLDNPQNLEKLKQDKQLQKKISQYLCKDSTAINYVKQIYRKLFWSRIKGDKIANQKITNVIFAQAVNLGVKKAVKILQKCLDVKQDGIIGNITLTTLNNADISKLIECLKEEYKKYYCEIVKSKPYLAINLAGWHNRVDRL